jgi:hypothetical protein
MNIDSLEVIMSQVDSSIPFDAGKYIASEIPNAEFMQLDSRNHVLLAHGEGGDHES